MPEDFPQAWTARTRWLLSHDDLTMDLSAATVALVGQDGVGTPINYVSPKVAVEGDGTTGIVTYDPDATDLTLAKSPLRLRFKVTIGGRDAFFPRAGPIVIKVEKP